MPWGRALTLIVTVGLMKHWGAMGGGGCHCHCVGIEQTLECHGRGALIVTVGIDGTLGAMWEGLSLSLCGD